MNLTIEGGALTLFWGSCLANLIWQETNRQAIVCATKKYASSAASYVINKSKKIIKKQKRASKQPQKTIQQSQQPTIQPVCKNQRIEAEQKIEPQKIQGPESKKKERRNHTKHRNLRKITRNYEDWVLRRAYLRKVQETPTNEFKEYLRQFKERKMSEQMFLSKPKEIASIQNFEKYVQEQMDIDEQEEMECILPYDPFVTDQEEPK